MSWENHIKFIPACFHIVGSGNFNESILLPREHQQRLTEWIGIMKKWKLVYKASRDGFGAKDFHKACDGKGENLGVIKSANGSYLFGWWTPLSWQSQGDWQSDTSTFIFTLTNPAGVSAKYKNKDSRYAIYNNAAYGPHLGGGSDIYVPDNSNVNDGYTNFPHSYEDTTGRGNATFTGNANFKVSELEVFVPV